MSTYDYNRVRTWLIRLITVLNPDKGVWSVKNGQAVKMYFTFTVSATSEPRLQSFPFVTKKNERTETYIGTSHGVFPLTSTD